MNTVFDTAYHVNHPDVFMADSTLSKDDTFCIFHFVSCCCYNYM